MQTGIATNFYNTTKLTVFIGMDVHKETFTLCSYTYGMEEPMHIVKTHADYQCIIKYINSMKKHFGEDAEFICGYEAGCLGYTLYRDLKSAGVECKILAPTTIKKEPIHKLKNDVRDSKDIARAIAYQTCSFVFVPNQEDEQVKDYIRMRNSQKKLLNNCKRQLLSFCLRNGIVSPHKNWTVNHILWLRSLNLEALKQEILTEYLITYERLTETLKRCNARISELANSERYIERIGKLRCFLGISDLIALSTVVEVGDFSRFPTAQKFSAYIGVVPGESSSGEKQNNLGITGTGNKLLRALYTESAQCIGRGRIGVKSKELVRRQSGQSPEIIAYADRASDRLRRKYMRLVMNGKQGNKARTAITRELCCFIWGMMTNNIA